MGKSIFSWFRAKAGDPAANEPPTESSSLVDADFSFSATGSYAALANASACFLKFREMEPVLKRAFDDCEVDFIIPMYVLEGKQFAGKISVKGAERYINDIAQHICGLTQQAEMSIETLLLRRGEEQTQMDVASLREAFLARPKLPNTKAVEPTKQDEAARLANEVWDETRFPPLTRFEGWLKQIIAAKLPPVEQAALRLGFPLFLGSFDAMRASRENLEEREERDFYRRRYSGDTHETFPRARYHSVCQDASGEDNITLLSELNAYCLPQVTGFCVARRADSPESIEIVFRGLPGEPNTLFQALSSAEVADQIIAGNPFAKDAGSMPLT